MENFIIISLTLTFVFITQLVILSKLSEDAVRKIINIIQTSKLSKLILYPIFAPGVILHELSHAISCYMVGGKVAKIVPFNPKQQEDGSWQFGYVNSMASNFIQHSLVALAPLWLGPILLWLLAFIFIPDLNYDSFLLAPFSNLDNDVSWQFIIWAFLLFSFSLSNFPSSTDLEIAKPLLYLIFLMLIVIFVLSLIFTTPVYVIILIALNILVLPSCLINILLASLISLK